MKNKKEYILFSFNTSNVVIIKKEQVRNVTCNRTEKVLYVYRNDGNSYNFSLSTYTNEGIDEIMNNLLKELNA